jgi:hypothetical protein
MIKGFAGTSCKAFFISKMDSGTDYVQRSVGIAFQHEEAVEFVRFVGVLFCGLDIDLASFEQGQVRQPTLPEQLDTVLIKRSSTTILNFAFDFQSSAC